MEFVALPRMAKSSGIDRNDLARSHPTPTYLSDVGLPANKLIKQFIEFIECIELSVNLKLMSLKSKRGELCHVKRGYTRKE